MREFNVEHDFITMTNWMQKRGFAIPHPRHLPPSGLIVDNAACGFIIKCDNGTAILDFLLSNPEIPDAQRSEAVDEIVAALIDLAKRSGMHTLYANTEIEAVYNRALRHGFEQIGSFKALMRGL